MYLVDLIPTYNTVVLKYRQTGVNICTLRVTDTQFYTKTYIRNITLTNLNQPYLYKFDYLEKGARFQ